MFESPFMDAVIFSAPGTPLSINWYGLSYLLALVLGAWILNRRSDRYPGWGITREMNGSLLFCAFVGLIIGARLGYVVLYGMDQLLTTVEITGDDGAIYHKTQIDVLYIFKLYEGGLSFHGGFIGVCAAYIYYAYKHKINPFTIADWIVPIVPIGITFVRGGNTINAELWGRVTDSPVGVYFMNLPENATGALIKRHPSTIYEMVLEGVVLFFILQWFIRKPQPRMAASGLFVLCYGIFRTMVEFFRQPDAQLGINGFLYGTEWITRGMTLSAPMIIGGAIMLWLAYRFNIYDHQRAAENSPSKS